VDLWFEKCAQIKPLIGEHNCMHVEVVGRQWVPNFRKSFMTWLKNSCRRINLDSI
jgi:hypothetical protein